MFKENWPLTGLVKLLNPAGGRQLRLIRQAGPQSCKLSASGSWLGWPGDHHTAQDNNLGLAGQWFRAQGNKMWEDTEWIMDAEAEHWGKWQTDLWHGTKASVWVSPIFSPLFIHKATGRRPTSRCSTSSLVKSVASSLKGSPSCTRPGRFRAPLGHSMPVSGEKENLWWKGPLTLLMRQALDESAIMSEIRQR